MVVGIMAAVTTAAIMAVIITAITDTIAIITRTPTRITTLGIMATTTPSRMVGMGTDVALGAGETVATPGGIRGESPTGAPPQPGSDCPQSPAA